MQKIIYIYSLPKEIKVFCGVELHRTEQLEIEQDFKMNGFMASYNPAEPLTTLNHGGEVVSCRGHVNSRPIKDSIIDHIRESQNNYVRFAARLIVSKQLEILIISIYLWDSEGFSDRNIILLKRLKMVTDLVGLPWICSGDFNLTSDEFKQSEWPDFLRCVVIEPCCETTVSTSQNRIIDFTIVSIGIQMLIEKSEPIYTVPWGPHWGLILTVNVKPKQIVGSVVCVCS